jgi:hypothetical protein
MIPQKPITLVKLPEMQKFFLGSHKPFMLGLKFSNRRDTYEELTAVNSTVILKAKLLVSPDEDFRSSSGKLVTKDR